MQVVAKARFTVPSFTSMQFIVCKFEKWRSNYREKFQTAFMLMVVMEATKYTYTTSIICKFESEEVIL